PPVADPVLAYETSPRAWSRSGHRRAAHDEAPPRCSIREGSDPDPYFRHQERGPRVWPGRHARALGARSLVLDRANHAAGRAGHTARGGRSSCSARVSARALIRSWTPRAHRAGWYSPNRLRMTSAISPTVASALTAPRIGATRLAVPAAASSSA